MRAVSLIVFVAACGATDEGAHLSISAPANLGPVSNVQIVLASADSGFIEIIDHQRTGPKRPGDETVTYYRQAASGGMFEGASDANKLMLRIIPNTSEFPQTTYIPFALAFSADHKLVGIGTVRTPDDPTPLPIKIVPGTVNAYTLTIEAVGVGDPNVSIAAGQGAIIECATTTQQTWRSGLAWRPATGPQIRVLFPDMSASGDAPDALSRVLDLDCDTHVAAATDDCDDTLPSFYAGAAEMCDGEDTNCDGQRYWATPCTIPGFSCPMSNNGVKLCDESASMYGQCQPDPLCACAMNSTTCNRCTLGKLSTPDAGKAIPCQPALGKLTIQCTSLCTVDVIGASPGLLVLVSADPNGPFGPRTTNTSNHLYLKLKLLAGPSAEVVDAPLGEFHLAIKDNGATAAARLESVAVELGDFQTQCPMSSGQITMSCFP